MNNLLCITLTCPLLLLSACTQRQESNERDSKKNPPAEDREKSDPSWDRVSASIAEQSISESVSEAIEMLGDTSINPPMVTLSLQGSDTPLSSCRTERNAAIVTSEVQRSHETQRQGRRSLFLISTETELTIIRNWSKADLAIPCTGSQAAIDFESDLSGYQLDVKIDRVVQRTSERRNLSTGEIVQRNYRTDVKGERSVRWLSQSISSDGTITRQREIEVWVTRTAEFVDRTGTSQNLSFGLNTRETRPLKVSNTWSSSAQGRTLLTETIESGTLEVARAEGSRLEASFNELRLDFSNRMCEPVSGEVRATYYLPGAKEPSRIYLLSIVSGDVKVEDITNPAAPVEVVDFEYTPCDIRNFQIP